MSEIFNAIKNCDEEMLESIISREPSLVNEKFHGEYPLDWAILFDNEYMVEILIGRGAKIHTRVSYNMEINELLANSNIDHDGLFLHRSAMTNTNKFVQILETPEKMVKEDANGYTPLMISVIYDSRVEFKEIDPDYENSHGESAMKLAVKLGRTHWIAEFTKNDPVIVDESDRTPWDGEFSFFDVLARFIV